MAPHLSAQQVRDRAQLAGIVSRCRDAGKITPVPDGVGSMTIVMLLANTLQAAKVQKGLAD